MAELTTQSVTTGLRLTVAGSVVGAFAGAVSERVADMIIDTVGLDRSVEAPLGETGVELVVRGGVSAVGFILADRIMRNIQGPEVDATQGLFFSFLFVQSQKELLTAAKRFADAATAVIPRA